VGTLNVPLFGLAPGGVYPAADCCQLRGALLPHHFTLTEPEGQAVYFLWHFPWARAPQALPGTLPNGARTFLRGYPQRLLGRLPRASYQSPVGPTHRSRPITASLRAPAPVGGRHDVPRRAKWQPRGEGSAIATAACARPSAGDGRERSVRTVSPRKRASGDRPRCARCL